MCPYAIKKDNEILICEPRNQLCTLCVFGNAKTYKEIKENKKD